MEVKLQAIAQITLEHKKGGTTRLIEARTDLLEPNGLIGYRDEDGQLNKDGVKALSQTLIQALNCNIQGAHQKGIRDSAEHIRWVIDELSRAFGHVVYLKE